MAAVLVCAVVAGFYYYHRVNEEVRRHIQTRLAKQYPSFTISVGSARVIKGEGIRIRALSVVHPSRAGGSQRAELVYADEVFLQCDPSVQHLLQGQVDVRHVHARGLLVRPTREASGKWNVADLLPLPTDASCSPTVSIEQATLELMDRRKSPPTVLAFDNIRLKLSPKSGQSSHASQANVKRALPLKLQVTLSSDYFRRASIEGFLDVATGTWSVGGRVTGLQYTPRLLRALPEELAQTPAVGAGLSAQADLTFTAEKKAAGAPLAYSVSGNIISGRLDSSFLPYPLADLMAQEVHFDNRGWQVRNLQATHGEARIHITAASADGYLSGSPVAIHGRLSDFTLTERLIDKLPSKLQSTWEKFRPLGRISAAFSTTYDGRKWSTAADVECLDVSLLYAKFRYPLQRARGAVKFRQDRLLNADLWALAGKTPIHIQARTTRPGPEWQGTIAVKSNGLLSIDETLISALKPKVQQALRALQARGRISFGVYQERSQRTHGQLERQAVVDVVDGWVRYERFAYPLQGVRGRLELAGDRWAFRDLVGRNDSCYVQCNGDWNPLVAGGELGLKFVATDVPCDDELRDALPAGPQRLWKGLRPTGTIDHITIDLTHRTGAPRTDLEIVLNQLVRKNDPGRGSLVIQPTWFPYRMERVTGTVRYLRDGRFQLQNVRARHGAVQLSTRGGGAFRKNGQWQVALDRINVDRLRIDDDLLEALPPGLRPKLAKMAFAGLMGFDGVVQFEGTSDPGEPVTASWDLIVGLDDGHLTIQGHQLEKIFGELHVKGRRDGNYLVNWGDLNLDWLLYKELEVRNLQGPWSMDRSRLAIGAAAAKDGKNIPAEPLRARFFDGGLEADGLISLGPDPDFQIDARLSQADVRSVAAALGSKTQVTGRADAWVRLAGKTQAKHTVRGNGGVRLTQANIYRMPAIISLLSELRVSETGPNVFSASNVDFRVQHGRFYFDRFDLHGEALTLKGQGEMGFDRRVNLDFYTILGGENRWMPIVRPLLGEASRQILRIRVTGPLENPQMTREVLPGLNETLQQAFPEQTSANEMSTRLSGADWFRGLRWR